MKRFILITAVLLGSVASASAGTVVWNSKTPRSDAQLHAANNYCDADVGPQIFGYPTTPAYKRCMASQGWKYVTTYHDGSYINRWGASCHRILGGFGSECSMF